jgi:hypothetical protein
MTTGESACAVPGAAAHKATLAAQHAAEKIRMNQSEGRGRLRAKPHLRKRWRRHG